MKLLKSLAAILAAATFATACTQAKTGSIVLKADITGDPAEVIVLSYLPGHKIGYHYPEVSDGRFEFRLDEVQDFADLIVSVGGMEFGARINVGDTLGMSFTVNTYAEDVEVAYHGSTEKESRLWTDLYETYMHWSRYGLTAEEISTAPYLEHLARLETNDSIFRAKYKDDFNAYYTRRSDLAHDLLKCILMEMVAYQKGEEPMNDPDYVAMLRKTDPDDPDQMVFPLVNRWMYWKQLEFEGSTLDQCVGFMKKYGRKMHNPAVRQMLADNMNGSCMRRIKLDSLEIYEPFFAEIEKFAPEGERLVADSRAQIQATLKAQPGMPVPDTNLMGPDGKEIALSSLFGKVLYIDVWATWCGPCRREGPYFQALAERYKDDPRICFISISTDRTAEPWLEYLAEEKPFWPQFRLDGANHDDFCRKVNIPTIPRFLLIGPDGKYINADCARPSNEKIVEILDSCLK